METCCKTTKKIRTGDRVVVLAGNDRGQTGVVKARKGAGFVVDGLNMKKRHLKKSEQAPQGRIIEKEGVIHGSNLRVVADQGDQALNLKVRTNKNGDREFVYANEGQTTVYRSVKKPK